MSIFKIARKQAEKLYDKTCSIVEMVDERENGIDYTKEVIRYRDIPCRISYKSIPSTEKTDTGAILSQSISLFCSPDIPIKAGSKILFSGKTYKSAGEPAVYYSHQKVELVGEREWA